MKEMGNNNWARRNALHIEWENNNNKWTKTALFSER